MILFFQKPVGGPVRMTHTTSVKRYMANLKKFASLDPGLVLIAKVQSRTGLLLRLRQMFEGIRISDDWYEPTPEFMGLVAHQGVLETTPRSLRRRLSNEEVLQIFNLCHEGDHGVPLTDAEVGAKFGVSHVTVGKVARGQVYRYLFCREETPVKGQYWMSLAGADGKPRGARYMLRGGKRSR